MNVGMLIFFFVGIFGVATTVVVLHKLTKKGDISDHIHALVVSVGLGATWMITPFAAFLVPGGHLDTGFAVFWVVHSLIVSIILYGGDRIYIRNRVKKSR